jgi:hypothetical protein
VGQELHRNRLSSPFGAFRSTVLGKIFPWALFLIFAGILLVAC